MVRITTRSLTASACRCRRRRFAGDLLAVIAVRVVAILDVTLALRLLLQEVRRGALRARTRNRAAVQREVALRVARTRIEDAAARPALQQLALAAGRALHAGRLRRGRLAAAEIGRASCRERVLACV